MSPRDRNVAELVMGAHDEVRKLNMRPKTDEERAQLARSLGSIRAQLEMAIRRLTGAWPEDCVLPKSITEEAAE